MDYSHRPNHCIESDRQDLGGDFIGVASRKTVVI